MGEGFRLLIPLLVLFVPIYGQHQQQFGGGFGQNGGSGPLWNALNYPNPTAGQFQECNMKMSAHICDPDGVLDESSRYRLDYDLKQLETRTRQGTARTFCEKKGVTAAMAVARKVQGGTQDAVNVMANDMLKKWTLDPQCQKVIMIVVSVDDAKFWAARDDKVPVYADELTDLFLMERTNFRQGRYQVALSNILRGTWEKALSKAGPPRQSSSGGGIGGGGSGGSTEGGNEGRDGQGQAKPTSLIDWLWVVLLLIVIPLLCCCCLCYCCCCKRSGSSTSGAGGHRRQMEGGREMRGGMEGGNGGEYTPGVQQFQGTNQAVYNTDGQGGDGLYPSRAVKDEGGGGSWA